jgi:hypothetical protein
MSILPENINGTQLSIRRSEGLNENVRVKAESLTNAFHLGEQILPVNHDSVFLH